MDVYDVYSCVSGLSAKSLTTFFNAVWPMAIHTMKLPDYDDKDKVI